MWIYNSEPLLDIPSKAIGFVYLIENLHNGKLYIGKKLFKHKRNKKLIESDWKSYTGSNKCLNDDIKYNKHPISKTILHICYSKSQCSYLEIKEQLLNDAILSPQYYNDWISCKITRKHMQKFQLIIENNT